MEDIADMLPYDSEVALHDAGAHMAAIAWLGMWQRFDTLGKAKQRLWEIRKRFPDNIAIIRRVCPR